jgi:murein DD-endopeptidase MepM/ murein hydrolase activator NlpD
MIALGMDLDIPPVDGVLYTWKEGDTVAAVAAQFQVDPQEILNWPGNNLDLANPLIEPGSQVMVPGGRREFRQWIIPTIPRGRAGVSQSVYGGGACEGGYDGAYGTGAFIWPAGNHVLSGNDYWDGHLGIDIAAGEGAAIYAADSGVVVFAGWATGGYGNMVMIDHGNGYQTVYAHLSSVRASCGQSVIQGGTIGYAGSTGNSTGAHLHFEVRYQGGFVSPWYVLPAP